MSRASDPPQTRLHHLNVHRLRRVKFIVDFAHDFLHQVLHGDQTGHCAVFVHHHGQMDFLRLHIPQQGSGFQRVGDAVGRAQQVFQGLGGVAGPVQQKDTGAENAHHIIFILVVHRIPGQACLPDGFHNFPIGGVQRDGRHIGNMGHHIPCHGITEIKDVFNPLFFLAFNGSAGFAQVHHHANFFLGDGFLFGFYFHVEQP